MSWQENLFQNIITIFVLTALFLVIYLRMTNKTIGEFVREFKDIFTEDTPLELQRRSR